LLYQFTEPLEGESWDDYKRRIIKCFVYQVYVFDDKLLIYYNVSNGSGSGRAQSDVELLEEALAAGFDQRSSGSTSLALTIKMQAKIPHFGAGFFF